MVEPEKFFGYVKDKRSLKMQIKNNFWETAKRERLKDETMSHKHIYGDR